MMFDLSISICFVTVLKNSKSNIFGKIVVVIIQRRNLLNNPFLFRVAEQ